MKRIQTGNLLALLCFLAAIIGFVPRALGQGNAGADVLNPDKSWQPVLTVSGRGQVQVSPDTAIVTLGMETQADTALAAQEKVNATLRKIIRAIKQLQISGNAITTTRVSLSPVYENPKPGERSGPPQVAGYRASNTIRIEVSDLTKVGKVIDAATEAGANRLQGVSFVRKDDLKARTRALRLAAKQARAKAEALADALGLELTGIQRVTVAGNSTPQPPHPMERALSVASATPVQPGQLTIAAEVTIVYQIRSAAGISSAGA